MGYISKCSYCARVCSGYIRWDLNGVNVHVCVTGIRCDLNGVIVHVCVAVQ